MKRPLVILAALAWFFGAASIALAIPVEISYTADNEITSWTIGGAGQSLGTNWNDWGNADTITVDLGPGSYDIVWEVTNWIGSDYPQWNSHWENNQAGLMAEISFSGTDLLSSSTWETSIDGSNWSNALAYGANNDPSTQWYTSSYHQGIIVGIDENAQWIWAQGNNDPGPLFIKTTIDIPAAHAPEPATLVLLGSGLMVLGGVSRRKIRLRWFRS